VGSTISVKYLFWDSAKCVKKYCTYTRLINLTDGEVPEDKNIQFIMRENFEVWGGSVCE
jgi:hypothetical protein